MVYLTQKVKRHLFGLLANVAHSEVQQNGGLHFYQLRVHIEEPLRQRVDEHLVLECQAVCVLEQLWVRDGSLEYQVALPDDLQDRFPGFRVELLC
jgi:hypothetical protein